MTRMWLPVVCVLALGCTKDDVEDTGDSGEVISDFERFIDVEVEATGDELLAPVIDGEYYRNLRKITFKIGPKVKIPKVVGRN